MRLPIVLVIFLATSVMTGCQATPKKGTVSVSAVETRYLIVRDVTGQLSSDRVRRLADTAQKAVARICEFWAVSPQIRELGKITVELDHPRRGRKQEVKTALFHWARREGRRIRVVRIFGVNGEPQLMVHKLTHAVFPHPDKLVRNMMGIPMEDRFGNRLSFPMSGFSTDAWVLALRQVGSYIPLTELGPTHEQWGMRTRGRELVVVNPARQHAAYAQAGSLGGYLLDTYGVGKVKAFRALSLRGERPWPAVFGLTLKALEANWIQTLSSRRKAEEQNVSLLTRLLRNNPDEARFKAQDLAIKTFKQ